MAQFCKLSDAEQEIMDYAAIFSDMGYATHSFINSHGILMLSTTPQLADPYDISMRLPWHDAPAAWM